MTVERLSLDTGLDWAICDTDSMAIAKPDARWAAVGNVFSN